MWKDEFISALKLFQKNNRFSRLIRKGKEADVYYSPEIEKKLENLNRFCITEIIWIFGVLLCLFTIISGIGAGTVVLLLIVYTLIDILIISPLVYLAYLPKPLSTQIKNSDEVVEEEKMTLEDFFK